MNPDQQCAFCQLSKRGSPALVGTCAWSCSSSLVEKAVRQCRGTSISATILWICLLMLSHSSALKNRSRTRKPSLWNYKRRGDCSSPESSGEAAQSKRKQGEKNPSSSSEASQHFLIFNFTRGICCKRFIKRLECQTVKNNLFQSLSLHKTEISSLERFVVPGYLI